MQFSEKKLQRYRSYRFRTRATRSLKSVKGAVRFVREVGLAFLWPVTGVDLPSLWAATAGDRPVPNDHDDPGHITWRWKDQMLAQGIWYYGKLLRGKSTFASLQILPCLYALSPRLGELDDFRQTYEAGHLSWEAARIAHILLEQGPRDTVTLRKLALLSSPAGKARFERALIELQRGLWILPIGISEAGSWQYAFVYDLLDRRFPAAAERARYISDAVARTTLAHTYLDAVGATLPSATAALFGWTSRQAVDALRALAEAGIAHRLHDGRFLSRRVLSFRSA